MDEEDELGKLIGEANKSAASAPPQPYHEPEPDDELGQMVSAANTQFKTPPTDYSQVGWGDVLKKGAKGFAWDVPSALGDAASGLYDMARHPMETDEKMLGLAKGIGNYISGKDTPEGRGVGDIWNNQLTEPNIKKYVAEKPAHAGIDVGMALTAPEAGLERLGASKLAMIPKVARYAVDPISQATGMAQAGLPRLNRLSNELIGHFGTGTGGHSLNMATRSGYEGGAANEAFHQGIDTQRNPADFVKGFETAVGDYRKDRLAEYQAGQNQLATDKQQIGLRPVANELVAQNAEFSKTPAGTTGPVMPNALDKATQPIRQELADQLKDWLQRARAWGVMNPGVPNEFFTPSGLDMLKKNLTSLRNRADLMGVPQSEVILNRVVDSLLKELKANAPKYAEMMENYGIRSGNLDAFKHELSIGSENTGTTARKLMSSMNNNVTANYGVRKWLADILGKYPSANKAMYGLAGQHLSAGWPRGLVNTILSKGSPIGIGAAAAWAAHNPYLLAAMPALWLMQSPYYMGKMANLTGKIGRGMEAVPWRGLGYAGHVNDSLSPFSTDQ